MTISHIRVVHPHAMQLKATSFVPMDSVSQKTGYDSSIRTSSLVPAGIFTKKVIKFLKLEISKDSTVHTDSISIKPMGIACKYLWKSLAFSEHL